MVGDHGTNSHVESIAISKFKATCLAVLERVRRSRRPVRVTRFGKPIADIVPPAPPAAPKKWIGSLADSATIVGDIVARGWDGVISAVLLGALFAPLLDRALGWRSSHG